jgi:uncharacterized membrane protein
MPKKAINWDKVAEAMARSTRGHASQEDADLCREAFSANRKKYGEVNKRVRAEVQAAANPANWGKGE